jgi:hypothetical protein
MTNIILKSNSINCGHSLGMPFFGYPLWEKSGSLVRHVDNKV